MALIYIKSRAADAKKEEEKRRNQRDSNSVPPPEVSPQIMEPFADEKPLKIGVDNPPIIMTKLEDVPKKSAPPIPLLRTVKSIRMDFPVNGSSAAPLPDVVTQTEQPLSNAAIISQLPPLPCMKNSQNYHQPMTASMNDAHSAMTTSMTATTPAMTQESPGPVRRVRFGSLPPPETPKTACSVPSSPSMRRRSMIPLPKFLPKPRN